MRSLHANSLAAAALLFSTLSLRADQRGDTPDTAPSTPAEQLARFHVPPGFEVQLVAAEPDIQKPINLNFDAAGRLWVTGSEMYPWPASADANGQPIDGFADGWRSIIEGFRVGDAPAPPPAPRDTVRILADFAAHGRAQRITVFADQLNIPSGIQPLPRKPGGYDPQISPISADGSKPATSASPDLRKSAPSADKPAASSAEVKGDTAIVYSIPTIWRLTDRDGDGFAEQRTPLYTGFGYTDTHGGASSFIYWIDGWIYGTHGFRNRSAVRDRLGRVTPVESGSTFRFRPDGTAFEIFTHGQTNPFGLAFDPLGHLFSADSHSRPVYLLLRGGYYEGIGKQHDGLGFAPRITDDDHGSSAIAGIAVYADDQWPAEFHGNLFNGNPVTRRINRDRLAWHGSTPQAIRMPDFLTCDDPWFRPVNLKLGPDGALYIADFYTPIIGHYEVPLTHPQRDRTHGRIWRVVYRGESAASPGSTRVPRVGEGVSPSRTSGDVRTEATPPATATSQEVRRGETPRPTRETRVLPGVSAPALSAAPAEKTPSTPDQTISTPDQTISLPDKTISHPATTLSTPDKTLSVADKTFSKPDKTLSVADKTFSKPDKTISGAEKTLSAAEKVISTPETTPSTPDQTVSNREQVASVSEKTAPASEKVAPASRKVPSASAKAISAPDLTRLTPAALVEKLAHPNLEVRRLATHELVDRVGEDAFNASRLKALVPGAFGGHPSSEDMLTHPPLMRAHLAWVLERLASLEGDVIAINLKDRDSIVRLFTIHAIAESSAYRDIPRDQGSNSPRELELVARAKSHPAVYPGWGLGDSDPRVVREVVACTPVHEGDLAELLRATPPADSALIYSLRMALRDALNRKFVSSREGPYPFNPEELTPSSVWFGEQLSDVSLAIPTPEAARFLLGHLQRTRLDTPRAGELLKHALIYLPEKKLGAIAKLRFLVAKAPLPRKLALATKIEEAARQRRTIPKELTAWSHHVLLETLASNHDELTQPALAAVRDLKLGTKLAPLARIARDETRADALRAAALEAVANLPESRPLLRESLTDPRPLTLRKRAADLLVQTGDPEPVLAALPTAPWELAVAIATALAKTDAGALALLDAVAAGRAPARALQQRAVSGALFARPPETQARAQKLVAGLPPEDARLDGVIAQRVAAFRAATAGFAPARTTAVAGLFEPGAQPKTAEPASPSGVKDPGYRPAANRGARVFQQHCAGCHRFRHAGGNVGPNLDGVAARGPQRLFEDILDPSRNVDPAFRQTIVELTDGRTFAGANPREADDALILTDATGTELRMPNAMIKTKTTLPLSMMPAIFETQLSAAELNDLVVYLLTPP